MVNEAKDTEWGKKHDYPNIKTIDQFKQKVPIQDYDTIKPFIEKLMKGEQNVLWPSEIRWFAKSSGTTSDKSKFIPVSKEALDGCHYKGGKDLMAMYCHNNPNTQVFSGKGLVMGGSHQVNKLNDKAKYGDVSAVMMQNMPWIAQLIKTPNLSIALMEEWEEKIDKMARKTMQQNVTQIAGVPSWTLVLFRKIFELTGKTDISEVWPNLELYIHGGVSFEPYREQYKKVISSPTMNYVETYNASEGFFSIQDRLGERDMLLMLDLSLIHI